MGLELDYIDGQTPIDEDEKEGLLIETIATKGELDEFEQQNIEEAIQWVFGRKFKAKEVFTGTFICNIHKRMFGDVWAWAGEFMSPPPSPQATPSPTSPRHAPPPAMLPVLHLQTAAPDPVA